VAPFLLCPRPPPELRDLAIAQLCLQVDQCVPGGVRAATQRVHHPCERAAVAGVVEVVQLAVVAPVGQPPAGRLRSHHLESMKPSVQELS